MATLFNRYAALSPESELVPWTFPGEPPVELRQEVTVMVRDKEAGVDRPVTLAAGTVLDAHKAKAMGLA